MSVRSISFCCTTPVICTYFSSLRVIKVATFIIVCLHNSNVGQVQCLHLAFVACTNPYGQNGFAPGDWESERNVGWQNSFCLLCSLIVSQSLYYSAR